MNAAKASLAFVSPVFLFPNDAGGKIRTTNVLRGLKGGAFDVTLIGPATSSQRSQWATELGSVCDRFVPWEPAPARPRWYRGLDLLRSLPVNVVADCTPQALTTVRDTLNAGCYDVVVFDFVHAAVLRPPAMHIPTVCFTHNVEAEIFERHAHSASSLLMRQIWAQQHAKMRRFELNRLREFKAVIAVSERDARHFRQSLGLSSVHAIPTGVDLGYFSWQAPPRPAPDCPPTVVFTGSMDWAANVDGVGFFIEQVWPLVLQSVSNARFVVVGRNPPAALTRTARATQGVHFTGFVDDVRTHVHSAQAFVIPLRIGGGTRIKAFEAMAMGCPVVSTAIGIEGLDVRDGEHYLCRDSPADQADAVTMLLRSDTLRERLSHEARRSVESRFGHRVVAAEFERICLGAIGAGSG